MRDDEGRGGGWGWGTDIVGGAAAAWTPASPTSNGNVSPQHWYKADAGTWQDAAMTTAAAADGAPVGGWEDQASNGDDVVQATTSKKPTLKLAIKNGLPVLRFDGGDNLRGAFTTGGAMSQALTVFAVAVLDGTVLNDGSSYIPLSGDDVTHNAELRKAAIMNPDGWAIFAGTRLEDSAANANWNIWTSLFNGNSSQLWHNGVSIAAGAAGSMGPDGVSVGCAYNDVNYWLGDIAEILLYAGNISTADKNEVGGYLGTRYNISYTDIA